MKYLPFPQLPRHILPKLPFPQQRTTKYHLQTHTISRTAQPPSSPHPHFTISFYHLKTLSTSPSTRHEHLFLLTYPSTTQPSKSKGLVIPWCSLRFALALKSPNLSVITPSQTKIRKARLISGTSAKWKNSFCRFCQFFWFPETWKGNFLERSQHLVRYRSGLGSAGLNDARPCHQVSKKRDIGFQVLMFPCF